MPATANVPRAIRIHFLNGTLAERLEVISVSDEWLGVHHSGVADLVENNRASYSQPVAGDPATLKLALTFDFVGDALLADVRIEFGPTSTSYIGISSLCVPSPAPTMTLRLHVDDSDPALQRVWRRYHILHQFGHMLGRLHGHQHPGAFNLDAGAAARYFGDAAYVHSAIVDKYTLSDFEHGNGGVLDPESVMVFPLMSAWALSGEPSAKPNWRVRVAYEKKPG